jgi:hypothetical protein
MPLMTYDDLLRPAVTDPNRKVAEVCLQRVQDNARPMPPAPAPRVNNADVQVLQSWVNSGYPSGRSSCGQPDSGMQLQPDAGSSSPDATTESPDAFVPPPHDAGPSSMLCHTCQSNADCNPHGGATNFCVQDPAGGAACGTVCANSGDCPNGFDCYQIVDSANNPLGNNCFPSNNGSCQGASTDGGVPPPDSGTPPPDAGGGCTDNWNNYASGFFSNNCARCHSSLTSKGAVTQDSSRIQSAIDTGAMPRDTTLSGSEISRIDNWFGCGMP